METLASSLLPLQVAIGTGGGRLPLASWEQAQAYLRQRPTFLASRSRTLSERELLLWDRAAAFWMIHTWRAAQGPWVAWAVLAGRGAIGPRVRQMVPGYGDTGLPWQAPRASLEFLQPALASHGVLWVPWPLDRSHVEQTFGVGSWAPVAAERLRSVAQRRAHWLECRWEAGLPLDRPRL